MYSIDTIDRMPQRKVRQNFMQSQVSSKIQEITLIRPGAHEYWTSSISL